MSDFALDPRLEADTTPVCDLSLSALRLMRDARFPWLILAPRIAGAIEIADLALAELQLLIEEVARVSHALRQVTRCDKLNVGALGNIVAQLHVHVVARRKGDAAWPGPVWGGGPAEPYGQRDLDRIVGELRAMLSA